MAATFLYLPAYRVMLCVKCQTYIPPTCSSQKQHLRQPPYYYKRVQLQAQLNFFSMYKLQRAGNVVLPEPSCLAIQGLCCLLAFSCCLYSSYLTWLKHAVKVYVLKVYGQKPAQQVEGALQWVYTIQTFFMEKQYIQYFTINNKKEEDKVNIDVA